jgi:hypothetical protein
MGENTIALDHAYVDGRRGLNPADFIRPQDPAVQAVAAALLNKLSGSDDSPSARMREAYNFVTLNTEYVPDMTQYGYEEVWAMPDEVLRRLRGDCEDLSFLLCSLLLALGVQAQVVFGMYKGQGHAWVEAQVDGAGGILESTSGQPFSGFADPAGYNVEGSWGGVAGAPGGLEDPIMALVVYLAPGLICFGVGAFLMIDDAQDAFKFGLSDSTCPGKPGEHGVLTGVTIPGLGPHIHHWWIGLLLVILSIIILAVGVVLWMLKYL